jgi:SAM-dependent methyltransferase
MISEYRESDWNLHVPQLLSEFTPCLFDGLAVIQDCGVSSPGAAELSWLRQTLLSLPVRSVLDFGCGIGLFVGLFEGLDYTGADRTPAMLEIAREKNPGKTFRGIEELETYDLIFTRAVVQHNVEPVKSELIQTFNRLLNKDGYYLAHEHDLLNSGGNTEGAAEYMLSLGFKLIETDGKYGMLFQKV